MTLGLLLADMSDPVHGQIAAGFEEEAGLDGYTVLIVTGLNQPAREAQALRVFIERGVDGIALVSSVIDPAEAQERVGLAPIVVVQPDHARSARRGDPLPPGVIQTDDASGVAAAARHLLACGYRRILYLGSGDRPSNWIRRDAAANVVMGSPGATFRDVELGLDAWRAPDQVAAAAMAEAPDAVVCYDDKLALALLDGLRDHGVRVPEEVGVVGFDGIPFAALSNPRLTTVLTPTTQMGRLAARALIRSIGSDEVAPGRLLPVELVVRESTRVRGERDGR
jgi:LacI family transcriptional regulator